VSAQTDWTINHAHHVKVARFFTFAILIGAAILLVLFRFTPSIDLAVSQYFFTNVECSEVRYRWGSNPDGVQCGEFRYEHSANWRLFRETFQKIPTIVAVVTLIWLLWSLFAAKHKSPASLFLPSVALGSLILGPVIIINFFKEISGRSRPIHSLEFGGFEPFTAAGDFSGLCEKNCSFLSGEASGAFWLLVFIPLLPARLRWPFGTTFAGLALIVSLLRVMFGRHYVSDISISALVSLFSIAVFWWYFASPGGQRFLSGSQKRAGLFAGSIRRLLGHSSVH